MDCFSKHYDPAFRMMVNRKKKKSVKHSLITLTSKIYICVNFTNSLLYIKLHLQISCATISMVKFTKPFPISIYHAFKASSTPQVPESPWESSCHIVSIGNWWSSRFLLTITSFPMSHQLPSDKCKLILITVVKWAHTSRNFKELIIKNHKIKNLRFSTDIICLHGSSNGASNGRWYKFLTFKIWGCRFFTLLAGKNTLKNHSKWIIWTPEETETKTDSLRNNWY